MSNGQPSLTWRDAVLMVLEDATEPMHYTAIAVAISERELKKLSELGAIPAAVVNTTLANLISDKQLADDKQVVRVGRGIYSLKKLQDALQESSPNQAELEQDEDTGVLQCFGMFWQRGFVDWTKRSILGSLQGGEPINFYDQVGIYLLHDLHRTIYVGRATDRMGDRLKAHTKDRLSGRWDRFSWFGLLRVGAGGAFSEANDPCTHKILATSLEAILIETLEPPLNRRRGDSLANFD